MAQPTIIKCRHCGIDTVVDSAGTQCLDCLRWLDESITDCPDCGRKLDHTGYCQHCYGPEKKGGDSIMSGRYLDAAKTCKTAKCVGQVWDKDEDYCWNCRQEQKNSKGNTTGFTGHGQCTIVFTPKCRHIPTRVLVGQDFSVWAGSKDNVKGGMAQFDLVINCSNCTINKPTHKFPDEERFKSLKEMAVKLPPIIELDWPDGSAPLLSTESWYELARIIEADKLNVLVFCIGGHGRTGTTLSALLMAFGNDAAIAVKTVRKHYCKEAVETQAQIDYLASLDFSKFPPLGKAKAKAGNS